MLNSLPDVENEEGRELPMKQNCLSVQVNDSHRLSAISIADSSCSNVTGTRASYIESDDGSDQDNKQSEDQKQKVPVLLILEPYVTF